MSVGMRLVGIKMLPEVELLAQQIAVPLLSVMTSLAHEIDLLSREARWRESAVRLILCAELRMDHRRVSSQCHIASMASCVLSVQQGVRGLVGLVQPLLSLVAQGLILNNSTYEDGLSNSIYDAFYEV